MIQCLNIMKLMFNLNMKMKTSMVMKLTLVLFIDIF